MRKMILGLIFLTQLTSAAQPVANQEILTTQKQSPRKRFTAWVQSQADATAKDVRTLYQYAQKMARSKQPVKPNEQELQALKNSGMKAGALLVAMGILYGGHRVWRKNELNKSLRDAAEKGDVEKVKALLAAGANVDLADSGGKTLLQNAVRNNNINVVKALLDAKANVDLANEYGITPLQNALNSDINIFKALLDAGADVNKATTNGYTPLINAVFEGDRARVEMLLDAGADVNKADNRGNTPLIHAVTMANPRLINVLLAAGADIDKVNNSGHTSLMAAVIYQNIELVKMLLHAGADFNKADNRGLLALDYANKNSNQLIIDLLQKNIDGLKKN